MDSSAFKLGIVVSRWNEFVTKQLLEGARNEIERYGGSNSVIVHVPGTWEIPVIARQLLLGPEKVDGIVALGCILQGATSHAGLLASDVSTALMNLQMETGKPVAYGIITPENMEQALDRSGMKMGNKGREAALAVIESLGVLERLK
jgi:6,7-dimethyl-8-ribityllumazine synthase